MRRNRAVKALRADIANRDKVSNLPANPKNRIPEVRGGKIPMTDRKRWSIILGLSTVGIIAGGIVVPKILTPDGECYSDNPSGCQGDAYITTDTATPGTTEHKTAPLPESMGTSGTMYVGDRLSRVVCKDFVFIDHKNDVQITSPVVAPSGSTGLLPITVTPSPNAANIAIGGVMQPDPGTYEWRQPDGNFTSKVSGPDECVERNLTAEQFGSAAKPQIALHIEGYAVYNDQPLESQMEGIAHQVKRLP